MKVILQCGNIFVKAKKQLSDLATGNGHTDKREDAEVFDTERDNMKTKIMFQRAITGLTFEAVAI